MKLVLPVRPAWLCFSLGKDNTGGVLVFLSTMTVFLFKMMQYTLPFKLNLIYSPAPSKPFSPFCASLVPLPHVIKRFVSKSRCF